MIVGGSNKYFGLGEKSNTDNPFEPCISPPLLSHISISELRSYSIFDHHAVMITKEGRGLAIGSNENGQIIDTIPKEIYEDEQIINIIDQYGHDCQLISAVCGHDYTLYLVCSKNSDYNQLVYVYSNENNGHPLFLNLHGRSPTCLFGGWKTSAAIDSEEGVYVITRSVFKSPNHSIKRSFLPKGEKATSIACCNSFIVVSTSSGRVFGSSLEDLESGRSCRLFFDPVVELEDEEIVEVCGTVENCLALSSKGEIFGLGSSEWGQIGLGTITTLSSKFTKILALNDYDIVAASSGCFHSIFVTSQGKVLTSGNNGCGQLLIKDGPTSDFAFSPVETVIKSGCSFCIAGNNVSVLFVDCDPPQNSPNRAIRVEKKEESPMQNEDKKSGIREMIEDQACENVRLRNENLKLRKKILFNEEQADEQADENAKLKEENDELKKIIESLKEEKVKDIESEKVNENETSPGKEKRKNKGQNNEKGKVKVKSKGREAEKKKTIKQQKMKPKKKSIK